jgi:predicted dienelactone hydrolase
LIQRLFHDLFRGLILILIIISEGAVASAYDPLAVPANSKPTIADMTVMDQARGRAIPIRVYLPQRQTPAPVVLFSHGLGGSREGNAFMGIHWAERGYVGVFLQHPGSDDSVWKDKSPVQAMTAMREAAGGQNFLLRVGDVPAVLDQLERWNKTKGNPLSGRLDLNRIGMSGHSFGAVTTEAVSGEAIAGGGMPFTDPRIKAAIMFSPSSPHGGTSPAVAFSRVKIPWLLMTGTEDVAPIGDTDVQSRLAVFPALPPGGKYELVLFGAKHSVFTDRPLPESEKRNPNHHRAILAISTAFWDAWLKKDTRARAWLDGNGPRSVLEKKDRWQMK